MQAELLRATTDDTIKLIPVPGRQADPRYPALATMSREEFVRNILPAVRRINNSTRYELNSAGEAAFDEWKARWDYQQSLLAQRNLAAHNDELQLREDIIEALMEEGKARHVAANLTNTEAKMLAEGRRLGII